MVWKMFFVALILLQLSGGIYGKTAIAPTPTILAPHPVTSICSCLCNSAAVNRPSTTEEVSAVAEEFREKTKGELIMDTKNLSATVNKKESASDERPSASYMGFLGIFMMAFVFGALVLFDTPRVFKCLKSVKSTNIN